MHGSRERVFDRLLFGFDLSIERVGAKDDGQASETHGVSAVRLGDGGMPGLPQPVEGGSPRQIVRAGCRTWHLHPTDTHRS